MSENQKKIINLVTIDIDLGTTISEEYIAQKVDLFSKMYTLNENEREEVIKLLHTRFKIRMDRGSVVKEKNHIPWYIPAKKDIKNEFWERYFTYLIRDVGLSLGVVNSLDAATDEMMDLLGNPTPENNFQRRGLVVGEVQSGKTATYTALINKAADAGYRVIILLTGTIEKLRKQTQGRLDEGFIGLDSAALAQGKTDVFVGAGIYNPNISGWAITSTTSDFRKSTAERLIGQLAGISSPVLFVLKKNKNVLEKLEQWLRLYNTTQGQTIQLPMLLIDDEADSASVNTKTDEDPNAINKCIRMLLKLFSKANYVGFTATPFANIFINPESTQEMLHDDLFPRDFIYALEAPSNYVSASSIYSENGRHSYMLKSNDDCGLDIPEKHKKDDIVKTLPPSLKEAIASFFIANAVRDLRGQVNTHRTMLINVSRFIAVQDQIAKMLDGYVRELQREIKNYHAIGEDALEYDTLSDIKEEFDKHFSKNSDFEFSWPEIQKALSDAIATIVVKPVNGGNAAKNLNYEEYKENGLRLIAVGGFSLSRGLTLEGLCVSYFYRNSKMYDTLMQMGRWFGYRDGYADICQIWMSEDAIEWYQYITEATNELRREVKRMQDQNLTPEEFGLRVRSDKNLLLVTARNKMKTAQDFTRTISLNGNVVETPYIHLDKEILKNNLTKTNLWAQTLKEDGYILKKESNSSLDNFQILNVPKQYVINLLSIYNSHYLNAFFRTDDLVELINNDNDGTLDKWDILFASGGGKPVPLFGQTISCVSRNFGIKEASKALVIGGKSSRLGETRFAKGGLTKEQEKEIEAQEKAFQLKTGEEFKITEDIYFRSKIKRNPLLVVYPIELRPNPKSPNIEEKQKIKDDYFNPIIGLSIGIPEIEGREAITYKYKINKVMAKELLDIDSSDDNVEEEDGIIN